MRRSATSTWATPTRPRASPIRPRSDGSGGHWMAREKDDRFVHFRSEKFKDLLTTMAALAAEHVFYGENTEGVGGDMSSVAHQAAIMVGHAAMPPERVPMPATMTRGEEEAARKKLDDYFLDTGGKLLAVASLGDHYANVLRAPDKRAMAARIIGHAYLIAYKFAEQNRAAISQVADELVERRELNGDEITELMDSLAHEAGSRRTTSRSARGHACDRGRALRRLRRPRRTGAASPCSTACSSSCSPPAPPSASTWRRARSSSRRRGRSGSRSTRTPRPRCARSPCTSRAPTSAPTASRSRPCAAGRSRSAATRRCSSSPTAQATGGYKFFEGASVEYQICGTTTKGNCTIDQKKIPPNTSGALTRRMAYELALTTFHYVPERAERRGAAAGRDQGPEGAHAGALAQREQGSEVARRGDRPDPHRSGSRRPRRR